MERFLANSLSVGHMEPDWKDQYRPRRILRQFEYKTPIGSREYRLCSTKPHSIPNHLHTHLRPRAK